MEEDKSILIFSNSCLTTDQQEARRNTQKEEILKRNIKDYNFLFVANVNDNFKIYKLDEEDKAYIYKGSILLSILIKHNTGREQIMHPSLYIFMKKNIFGGGYKKAYLLKELKDIAKRNNIKITKKSNGKDVYLNKQELTTKLKKIKLI